MPATKTLSIPDPHHWDLTPAESLYARLLGGHAPGAIRSPGEEQSHELLALLLRGWQLLPELHRTRAQEIRGALDDVDFQTFTHAALAIEAFARTQYVVTGPLLDRLRREGIDHCLLKGAAAAYLLYEQPYHRAGWDIDIAVRRRDLRRAEALAIEHGFMRAQQDPDTKRFHPANPRLRAEVEAQHYELGFLVRRQFVTNLDADTIQALQSTPWTHRYWFDVDGPEAPWCYSAVDIHHGIALGIGLDDVIDRSRAVDGTESPVAIPTPDWMAAILVYKLYWEGVHQYRAGLYQYADLCRLLPRLDDEEFLLFLEHVEALNLVAAAHYVLRRLPVFGVSLTQRERELIDISSALPEAEPPHVNDMGDMWSKLWGRRLLC